MNKEQKVHYLKGGKFIATYQPKSLDIVTTNMKMISKEVVIFQNCLNSPIQDSRFNGQFRFNSHDLHGWSPEEDFKDLHILDDFIDYPEKTTVYLYKLSYLDQSKLQDNFGKGNWKAPMEVYREYQYADMDEHVMKLSNPQACKIEKKVIDLLTQELEDVQWETIL